MVFKGVLSCMHSVGSCWLLRLGSDKNFAFSKQPSGTAIILGAIGDFIFVVWVNLGFEE